MRMKDFEIVIWWIVCPSSSPPPPGRRLGKTFLLLWRVYYLLWGIGFLPAGIISAAIIQCACARWKTARRFKNEVSLWSKSSFFSWLLWLLYLLSRLLWPSFSPCEAMAKYFAQILFRLNSEAVKDLHSGNSWLDNQPLAPVRWENRASSFSCRGGG